MGADALRQEAEVLKKELEMLREETCASRREAVMLKSELGTAKGELDQVHTKVVKSAGSNDTPGRPCNIEILDDSLGSGGGCDA